MTTTIETELEQGAEAAAEGEQLAFFPGVDGKSPSNAILSIGGNLDLSSWDERERDLVDSLTFGRRVALVLVTGAADDVDQTVEGIRQALERAGNRGVVIDGTVTQKGHAGKIDAEMGYLTDHRLKLGIKLGGVAHVDTDDEGDE